jgi:hypothetical protein
MPDATPTEATSAEATPGQDAPGEATGAPPAPAIHPGDAVRLIRPLRYLKTADPMPMLRPPDLVDPGEVGRVVEIRALDLRAVRFRRGTFLISVSDLEPVTTPG